MQELTKKYYRIGEVADLLEVPATTLRFWEGRIPQIRPRRGDNGMRYYTPKDIDILSQIKYLIYEKGLHIDAAIRQLRANPEGIDQRHKTIARLKDIRDRLKAMEEALRRLR